MQDSSPHHPLQFLVPKFNFRFLQAAAGERRRALRQENMDEPNNDADMVSNHPSYVCRNDAAYAEISTQSRSRKFKTGGDSESKSDSSRWASPRYVESTLEDK